MKSEKNAHKNDSGTKHVVQQKNSGSFIPSKGHKDSFTSPLVQRKSNSKLPNNLQSNMETSLGQDFSNVGIHTNSQKAVQMNARAFTQNEQVHFAPGEFNPNSAGGQNLIGHEFTHIAQQRAGVVKPTKMLKKGVMVNDDKSLESEADAFGKKAVQGEVVSKYRGGKNNSKAIKQAKNADQPIQRLIKSPYPWTGIVEGTSLLALRDAPSGNTMADLPKGTLVNVTANSGGWLNVEIDTSQKGIILNKKGKAKLSGNMLTGFCGHSYINDATASTMIGMVGNQEWKNPTGSDFYQYFVVNNNSGKLPNTASMNCWESIMYAAYVTKQIDTAWIKSFYGAALPAPNPTASVWAALGWHSGLPTVKSSGAAVSPNVGDLIFYTPSGKSYPSHVALYVGSGEVISLWNQPNNNKSVQRISITALSGDIQFNSPPW